VRLSGGLPELNGRPLARFEVDEPELSIAVVIRLATRSRHVRRTDGDDARRTRCRRSDEVNQRREPLSCARLAKEVAGKAASW
jgi:hypothetical protein